VRRVRGACVIIAGLALCAPAQAADLGGNFGGGYVYDGLVRAGPLVEFNFQPGTVLRAYWLPPWGGRHYFPAEGKMPAVGRKEVVTPKRTSGTRDYNRSWTSFPVDTIVQPPLVNAPSYYGGNGHPPPPSPPGK
jgi:hypothetical protein